LRLGRLFWKKKKTTTTTLDINNTRQLHLALDEIETRPGRRRYCIATAETWEIRAGKTCKELLRCVLDRLLVKRRLLFAGTTGPPIGDWISFLRHGCEYLELAVLLIVAARGI